ncbi:MAG: tetratricopeptide repeat protein [Deltaproteobacteria bacterium]|nr:tetratricopeptide repeat protein [Deltaproteobacteria bacterium]
MSTVLDQHKQSFESDPSNKPAFDALEEHYFMAGQWDQLVAVYDRRLAAPEFSSEPTLSVPILFRLAQVYEERCLDTDLAIENYWKAAKIDPTHRAALRQLRQIYAQRDQWDMVLQIAEMEGQLEMELHEKAGFLAELGNLWNERLSDPSEAMTHFQDSLALVPDHMVALTGLAQVHEALGHHQQAAAAWERLSSRLRGPDRAPVLVSLGKILAAHLDQPERAVECFRRALDDDPRCAGAIAALTATATRLENWPLWFDRALELVDEEVSIFYGFAELERRTGNHTALSAALDRVIELRGDEVPIGVLLESADLHSEAGNDDTAIKLLRQAQVRAPEDVLVAETLSDCLARMGLSEELVGVLERRAALTEDDPRAQSEFDSETNSIPRSGASNSKISALPIRP